MVTRKIIYVLIGSDAAKRHEEKWKSMSSPLQVFGDVVMDMCLGLSVMGIVMTLSQI